MHHGAGLRAALKKEGDPRGDSLVEALESDYTKADLRDDERAMLDYAGRLTLAPGDVGAEDALALRAAGFDDRTIHDICAITAYFAFVNRIADGLGIELEE